MAEPSNQIGRIMVYDKSNNKLVSNILATDYLSKDYLKFGENWFNLPDKDTLLKSVLED